MSVSLNPKASYSTSSPSTKTLPTELARLIQMRVFIFQWNIPRKKLAPLSLIHSVDNNYNRLALFNRVAEKGRRKYAVARLSVSALRSRSNLSTFDDHDLSPSSHSLPPSRQQPSSTAESQSGSAR